MGRSPPLSPPRHPQVSHSRPCHGRAGERQGKYQLSWFRSRPSTGGGLRGARSTAAEPASLAPRRPDAAAPSGPRVQLCSTPQDPSTPRRSPPSTSLPFLLHYSTAIPFFYVLYLSILSFLSFIPTRPCPSSPSQQRERSLDLNIRRPKKNITQNIAKSYDGQKIPVIKSSTWKIDGTED